MLWSTLHWTNGEESLHAMHRFFNPGLTPEVMLDKIRRMMQVLPAPMATVIRYAVLTGLRPSEVCESVRLLTNPTTRLDYYNEERQILEHFRFPEVFLRRTKKAFISYITLDNLQPIAALGCKTQNNTFL